MPIYRQIIDQCKQRIASGQLEHGDKLPTVRALATELGINPMTISKAYNQLESDGLVERRPGVGMIVGVAPTFQEHPLIEPARELVRSARTLGLNKREIDKALRQAWEEDQ